MALPAFLFATLFFFYGLLIAPLAGIQNDEILFASSLYPPNPGAFRRFGVPLMTMDYLGCLKTWIYAPIFAAFHPSVWSLRVPAILIGSLTITLFAYLLYRAGGLRAAWFGAAILAFDPSFALTTVFDWGPVALQHLLLVGGLLAGLQFDRSNRTRWLALAAFLFGLGLWDKALFAWMLTGVCLSALVIWPRHVLGRVNPRNILIATLAFLAGAAPLLWFNINYHWLTFRSNTAFTTEGLLSKVAVLHYTANGSVLFEYIVNGVRRSDLLEYALAIGLLALPFLWRTGARKPAIFSLLAFLIAWAQMTFNRGTGGSAHHLILLWPMPALFLGVILARLRVYGLAIVLVLISSDLIVLQHYQSNLRTAGAPAIWSDAMSTLAADPALGKADSVCIVDWGFYDPLQVLSKGALPLRFRSAEILAPSPTRQQQDYLETDLRNPANLWLSHIDGQEQFTGVNDRLTKIANTYGLQRVSQHTYRDRRSEAVYETFRFTARP